MAGDSCPDRHDSLLTAPSRAGYMGGRTFVQQRGDPARILSGDSFKWIVIGSCEETFLGL